MRSQVQESATASEAEFKKETKADSDAENEQTNDNKILIVYFTHAENTEGDAISGATPIIEGCCRKLTNDELYDILLECC